LDKRKQKKRVFPSFFIDKSVVIAYSNAELIEVIGMCDDEGNTRLDRSLAAFVTAASALASKTGNPSMDLLVMASIPPFDQQINALIRRWERILGAAENLGLPEKELKARRDMIAQELRKSLGEWTDLWFDCSYAIE
jgi:hypothetical protein